MSNRHVLLAVCLSLACGMLAGMETSQPPAPGSREGNAKPKAQSNNSASIATPDQHGTESTPAIVRILPAPRDQAQAEEEERERREQAADRRWTKAVAILTLLLGLGQLWMIRKQANISKSQNEIATRQNEIIESQTSHIKAQADYTADSLQVTRDAMKEQAAAMKASISEATKTTKAMERIADAMGSNVEQLGETIAINKQIAATSADSVKLASAAYVDIKEARIKETYDGQRLASLDISYKLYNASSNVATISGLEVSFRAPDGEPNTYHWGRPETLAPGRGYHYTFAVPLTEQAAQTFNASGLLVRFTMSVTVTNILGESNRQEFRRFAFCGHNGRDLFIQSSIASGSAEDD